MEVKMSFSAVPLSPASSGFANWFLPVEDEADELPHYVHRAAHLSVRFRAAERPPPGFVTLHHDGSAVGFWGNDSAPTDMVEPIKVFQCEVCESRILRSLLQLCKRRKLLYTAEVCNSDSDEEISTKFRPDNGVGGYLFAVSFWIHLHTSLFTGGGGQDLIFLLRHSDIALDKRTDCEEEEEERLSLGLERLGCSPSDENSWCCVSGCQLHPDTAGLSAKFRLGQVLLAINSTDAVAKISQPPAPTSSSPGTTEYAVSRRPLEAGLVLEVEDAARKSIWWEAAVVSNSVESGSPSDQHHESPSDPTWWSGFALQCPGRCEVLDLPKGLESISDACNSMHITSPPVPGRACRSFRIRHSSSPSSREYKVGQLVAVKQQEIAPRKPNHVRWDTQDEKMQGGPGQGHLKAMSMERMSGGSYEEHASPCSIALVDAFIVNNKPSDATNGGSNATTSNQFVRVRFLHSKAESTIPASRIHGPRPARRLPFHSLPDDVLVPILDWVGSSHLTALATLCRPLRDAARLAVPGLTLTLYRHQRRALEWMLHRELHPGLVPSPQFERFATDKGHRFLCNVLAGGVLSWAADTPGAELQDVRGGLLCDEPGMGKTVTVMALILKSLCLKPPLPSSSPDSASMDSSDSLSDLLDTPPGCPSPSTSSASFSTPTSKPKLRATRNGSGSGLVQAMQSKPLAQSLATLIVVPGTLLDHWEYQIRAHTRPGVLSVISIPKPTQMQPASVLAAAHVVLTTFDVLSHEWSVGAPSPGSQ
eukprot:CAMPEP_0181295932 /NCGR_PEP_ID=MMETSP1101-20121128/4419_1 /TAXON_ID=46948 /ORGANISM="Rhodomonas abbreviata, Strain Caron Lab Isolate" /LENGTH=761 /DNA_ID=CAMNT_0023400733 /DNA_START=135 /DNA_END=2417 /DNA_ORIENTATION=-